MDSFQVISDWYHFAILEIISLPPYSDGDPKAIARALGLTHAEITAALERLQRLKLLARQPNGRLSNISGNNSTLGGPDSAPALRSLQRSILQKAILALEEIPVEVRDQSSMTMAVDSKRLPEARAAIKSFRRKLSEILQSSKTRDAVYHLGISLYPVTPVPNSHIHSGENK